MNTTRRGPAPTVSPALIVGTYRRMKSLRKTAKALGLSPERVRQIIERDSPEDKRPVGKHKKDGKK